MTKPWPEVWYEVFLALGHDVSGSDALEPPPCAPAFAGNHEVAAPIHDVAGVAAIVFTPGAGSCSTILPMPPVELMVSFSCNQAMGNGSPWRREVSGLTPETSNRLRTIHERLFGPVAPQGA